MTYLLMIRERIKSFYSRYEGFCNPALKFILAFIAFRMINKNINFAAVLTSLPITLILSLLCSFFPMNFILVMSVLVILLHLYALSLETVMITGVIFLIMFLMYFRFSPKDTILLIMTPLCFVLKIPYVIPICAGLVAAPTSVISTGCGVVTYHLLHYIAGNSSALMTQEDDPAFALEKLRVLIDALMSNREMQVEVAAFAITILVVYIIRRLPVDHCWTIAMITGMLIDIVVILVGDLRFETRISIAGLIIGSIMALVVAIILKFFIFNVDYSRTERVQFEDDEYYYYVKAVPKNTVALTEKKVKKIKGSEKAPAAAEETDPDPDNPLKDAPEYRLRRSGSTAGNKNRTRRIRIPEGIKDNKT